MTVWFYMNEMVRDGKSLIIPHRDTILSHIADETEDTIFDFQMRFLSASTGGYLPRTLRASARAPVFDFVLQTLIAFCSNKNKKPLKNIRSSGSKMIPKFLSALDVFKKNKKMVATLTDDQNRIKLLKDYLPVFCTTLANVDLLEEWREDIYPLLDPFPITQSQAWSVVKLVYTSDNYTADQRVNIYDNQNNKTPGLTALMTLNTILALETTDPDIYGFFYDIFKEE